MIVAIHQPDLLPYSGFWFKMVNSDVFVIAQHDQFQKHGYQRRVTMRDAWCSHQLDGKPSLVPITSVQVLPGWQDRLTGIIRGRYAGARHWKERGLPLLAQIARCEGQTLAEVNLSMIHLLRDVLDIRTPLAFTEPPVNAGIPRLIEQVHAAGGDVYLSGSGGAAYMGENAVQDFADADIELRWSEHVLTSGDSVLTVLFDHDDPLAVISRMV